MPGARRTRPARWWAIIPAAAVIPTISSDPAGMAMASKRASFLHTPIGM